MNKALPPQDWDHLLLDLEGSVLQSRPWALFQQQLGRQAVWQAGNGWQWLAFVRESHGLRYLACSYGPAARDGRAMSAALKALKESAEQLGVDFIRVEPQAHTNAAKLSGLGARQIAELNPQYSRLIDLTASEAELRAHLSSGHRNRINGTERRGIAIAQSEDEADFTEFLTMLSDTAKRAGVRFYDDSYFMNLYQCLREQGVAKLYMARVEDKPVAAALFYDWGTTRYYAHAGAYQDINRKVGASVSLVWQAIVDAKQAGLQQFDLWGVAPEGDEHHHLSGLSTFKVAFGGQQVAYIGTWDWPMKRLKYGAYQVYRQLRGRR